MQSQLANSNNILYICNYREVNGDASESAILRFMETQFKNVKKYRTKHAILCEIPFNSRTKYQVFVHQVSEKSKNYHLVTIKGAPEAVSSLCNRILVGGNEFPMTPAWRNQVEQAIQSLGSLGERVIGNVWGECAIKLISFEYDLPLRIWRLCSSH